MSKKYILLVVFVLLALIAGLGVYAMTLFSPVDSKQTESTTFVIPKGQATSIIALRLEDQNLVRNSLAFRFTLQRLGLEDKLQAGSFKVSPSMKLSEIAQVLIQGTNDSWLTIPEGWRVEQIADSIDPQEFTAFDKLEFLELVAGQEGYLFPDTYLFAKESTAQTIFQALINNFDKKVVVGLEKEIQKSERDFTEVIILASIIEREARGADEMRYVAGILWNRIDISMALQVDATLQYIKGFDPIADDWWSTPFSADKKLVSLFNTYLHPGLPPAPIANPGLNAIKAALDPVETDNLYYLHDADGGIHYAQTLDGHNANIQSYLR